MLKQVDEDSRIIFGRTNLIYLCKHPQIKKMALPPHLSASYELKPSCVDIVSDILSVIEKSHS